MHFLLISENEFLHEIKSNGKTIFTEFISFTVGGHVQYPYSTKKIVLLEIVIIKY